MRISILVMGIIFLPFFACDSESEAPIVEEDVAPEPDTVVLNCPDHCQVTHTQGGKKVLNNQAMTGNNVLNVVVGDKLVVQAVNETATIQSTGGNIAILIEAQGGTEFPKHVENDQFDVFPGMVVYNGLENLDSVS